MPNAPKHYCKVPDCNVKVERGETYCKTHKQREQKAYDRIRGTSAERGYDGEWQKVQAIYKRENPLCEDCRDRGITKLADLVHHIVPISKGGDRLAFSNLKSLCKACHDKIHGVFHAKHG